MFIGHLGVGLALKRADRSINLAWLFGASLFLDLILWLLIFFEVEKVTVPPNYTIDRYLLFDFPYSHSMLAAVVWSLILFFITLKIGGRKKTAVIIAIAVFSHFVLDWLVHVGDLPILGSGSPKLGLGLWEHVMTAFFLEILLLLAGLVIYYYSTPVQSFTKRINLFAVMTLVTIRAYMGQMRAPIPDYANQIAINSLTFLLLLIILAYWLDRESMATVTSRKPGASSGQKANLL